MPLGSLSFTASVDGGSPTNHHLELDEPFPGSLVNVEAYNFTMYNITSLSLGSHALLVTLLDAKQGLSSYLYFDYAFVNSPNDAKPTASIGPSSNIHPSTTSAVNPSVKSTSR